MIATPTTSTRTTSTPTTTAPAPVRAPAAAVAAAGAVEIRTLSSEELRSAYHEAGHAIMARLLQWPVTTVTIEPERLREGELGRCELVRLRATAGRGRVAAAQRLRAHLLVSWSGVAAEWLATGGEEPDWDNATSDMEDIGELVELLCPGDTDAADLTADWGYACARGMLGTPLARAAIEAVAQALLEEHTLDAARLAELVGGVCTAHGVCATRGAFTANRVLSSLMLVGGK